MIPDVSHDAPAAQHQNRTGGAEVQRTIAISLIFFHLGCLLAPFTFSWSAVGVAVLLWWLTGGVGVCLGFHRLLTHGAFRTFRPVRYALAVLGSLANEGPLIVWVGTHRLHHQHADTKDDPHSPRDSFSWGHVFWSLFYDHDDSRRAARDLSRDPFLRRLDRFFFVPTLALAAILYAAGGTSWLVWGIFVRTVLVLHGTWLVNSASHRWGYRNFDTPDDSRNNWWVALLTFGEGWHNNHHADQRSAAHGMRWWEIDPTFWLVRLMELTGLAWDVKRPGMVPTDLTQSEVAT